MKNWKPPNSVINNYKQVEPKRFPLTLVTGVEWVPESIQKAPKFEYVPPPSVENHYLLPAEYQQKTGRNLSIPFFLIGGVKDEEICKKKTPLNCKNVGTKFEDRPDGVYLKSQNEREEAKRLCNFSFKIESLRNVINRDGSIQVELMYSVKGTDLVASSHCATILEENYDSIVDDILRRHKECYIVTEHSHKARDYLKEYGAIIYRGFCSREGYPVKTIFTYSGWENISGKNVYLSATKRSAYYECNCDLSIPFVPREKMAEIWNLDVKILEVGKKIYDAAGQIDYYESWKTLLPFWLYLHLSFACKLFLDAGVEVQFIFITGSLKTSLCKTFAEVFNERSMLRFESTGVALENYMEKCVDQIMIVDDLFKEDPMMKKKFEVIIRVFGDGIGRAKSTGKDYKENIQAKVRGGCIVTAEHNPNAQQSSTLRYVTSELGNGTIDTAVLAEFQTDKQRSKLEHRANKIQEIFGGWIGFLENHYEDLVQCLAIYQPPPINFGFKRYQQIYKVFCAVSKMIIKWGIETGAIPEQQGSFLFEIWHTIIADFIRKNQNAATTTEPYQQFLITLQQAVATGTVLVASNKEVFEQDGQRRYMGFYRIDKGDTEYVLNPHKIMNFVRKQLLESGKELVSDPARIFKDLLEHGISKGYVNKDGSGGERTRYLKRIKIKDNQAEMLILSKMAVEKTIEKLLMEVNLS